MMFLVFFAGAIVGAMAGVCILAILVMLTEARRTRDRHWR